MDLFKYNDYRDLVSETLKARFGHGARAKLATALQTHPGYISQVLSKSKIHFSAENLMKVSSFLGLSNPEEEFLMALLQLERSGSVELEQFWRQRVEVLRRQFQKVEKQVTASRELSDAAKAIYYSHWSYSAVHMVVSIDAFSSPQEIAHRLRVSGELATKVLAFLTENGLVSTRAGRYEIGKTRIHLKADSPLVRTHHHNFRTKALVALEDDSEFNLNYSAVLTLSKKDAIKIRSMLLEFLKEAEVILGPSENEDIVGLNLDLFRF
jgi:uncharacterized protein (TIGR02147 family)